MSSRNSSNTRPRAVSEAAVAEAAVPREATTADGEAAAAAIEEVAVQGAVGAGAEVVGHDETGNRNRSLMSTKRNDDIPWAPGTGFALPIEREEGVRYWLGLEVDMGNPGLD